MLSSQSEDAAHQAKRKGENTKDAHSQEIGN
jgi:hypothetical protein